MLPFKSNPTAENTRAIPGALFHFLIRGHQTAGTFSLIEVALQPGAEPPAHIHHREDESYYLLEGSIKYQVGNQEFTVHAGEVVHLPKGVLHSFQVLTPTARKLMLITPAGLEEWFFEHSMPAVDGKALPIPQGPPPQEAVEEFVATLAQYGVIMPPSLAALHK